METKWWSNNGKLYYHSLHSISYLKGERSLVPQTGYQDLALKCYIYKMFPLLVPSCISKCCFLMPKMGYQLYQGIQLPLCSIPGWAFRHHQHFPSSRQLQHSPSSGCSCTSSLKPWPCQGSWTPNLFSRGSSLTVSPHRENHYLFWEHTCQSRCHVHRRKKKKDNFLKLQKITFPLGKLTSPLYLIYREYKN